jgi:hypothetical protein
MMRLLNRFLRPKPAASVEIRGSYGTLISNLTTGAIIERIDCEGEDGYPEIAKFDPGTLKGQHMDILECGYWSVDGTYEPPEPDFVAHVADLEAGGTGLL